MLSAMLLGVLACKGTQKTVLTSPKVATTAYPTRPSVPPPAFRVFHQDNDTYTLVTAPGTSDEQVSALLWQFRDAGRMRGFDQLHLSQAFIDAREPTVWMHVYRGAKCASEKYTKGPLPCEAAYHGAGDFTLGAYNNPAWNSGVLHHADGSEAQLWDADAP